MIALVTCINNDDVTNPPEDENPPPPDTTFVITGTYSNQNNNPVFTLDSSMTSEILLGANVRARISVDSPLFVDIVVTDLSIADSISSYTIKSVVAEERRSDTNGWIVDTEFILFPFQRLEKINVALVLDVSQSLGDDFDDVKSFAKTFVNIVFTTAKNPKMGAVHFSTNIFPLSLVSDSATINTFIDGAQQEQFTALYDAMLEGIDIVEADTAEGEAIVTFTDGTNNFGTADSGMVKSALFRSGIQSYTIGFMGKGNLNEAVLKDLALNGGEYFEAETLKELEDVFELIALLVSDAITFTYRRNSQAIPASAPIGIRFLITAARTTE
jgi:hypothetical protein